MASPARTTMRAVVVLYVGVIILLPVGVLCFRAFQPGIGQFFHTISSGPAPAAFQRSALVAACSVVINTVFGVGVAMLLARRRFAGKRVLDAIIDLPIAISPIVVGLALVLVYGVGGWFGLGVNQVIGATPGLVLATTFVSLPLVLRSVLPVLEEAGIEQEQAAASLGASAVQTFRRITLPTIRVALGYGVVLALARCIGEYGAVLVVSGNFQDQATAPLLISQFLQNDFDKQSAYDLAFVLMLVSVVAIVAVSLLQGRRKKVGS
ncbi:MAG: sulfate ABC transporter permease subunit [Jatrophihabitans sp.]|uniref:sulfate ABC transporter permease subunit n=1 Tax=Jatrophihabitans sp. TaxID=1932789 RepID=UPI003F80F371